MHWKPYCRSVGQSGGEVGRLARICLLIGGRCPSQANAKLRSLLASGRISDHSYEIRAEAVQVLTEMWREQRSVNRIPTPEDDWAPIGEGCHMRRVHCVA